MNRVARHKIVVTALAWSAAGGLFFPIFWMLLTGFKTEVDALSPRLVFRPTLENYVAVQERANRK